MRELIETRRPLFEFAIRTAISQVDLDTVEGQVTALRMAAPVVARIRDRAMRPEYARRLAGWLGMEERTVPRAVHDAARTEGGGGHRAREVPPERAGSGPVPRRSRTTAASCRSRAWPTWSAPATRWARSRRSRWP
ncbi:hypothetical protein [Brachybacterium sp. GPGPB12]|uniref:hypothetical protein n=1 Tax=Brachybacterium sp. GPGPB12 TaxID=3023517 RepID=UPI0031342AA7